MDRGESKQTNHIIFLVTQTFVAFLKKNKKVKIYISEGTY